MGSWGGDGRFSPERASTEEGHNVLTSKIKNEEVGYGGKEEGKGRQGEEEGWQEEEVVLAQTFDCSIGT
jgi:hypothetical protein